MIILITKKNSIKKKKLEKDIENKINILLPYITTTIEKELEWDVHESPHGQIGTPWYVEYSHHRMTGEKFAEKCLRFGWEASDWMEKGIGLLSLLNSLDIPNVIKILKIYSPKRQAFLAQYSILFPRYETLLLISFNLCH